MILRFIVPVVFWMLAACSVSVPSESGTPVVLSFAVSPTPTARLQSTAPVVTEQPAALSKAELPTSTIGTVSGSVCYPSTETPPMTLYFEHTATGEVTTLDIGRGQSVYGVTLPDGQYVAYALTLGMRLKGAYTCNSQEPCPFQVESGRTTVIDLCDWYSPPGVSSPAPDQAADEVRVRLLQNMFARTGPHLSYPELGLVEAGTSLQALGRSADGEWLLVEQPKGDVSGWLHAPLTQIRGDPNSLPLEPEPSPGAGREERFVPTIWRSEHNRGIVLFKGEIRDEAERPVNGISILLDNGTWSVLSHPTGASHHYPDVGDGQWDVVIDNETDAAGWWTMTVVRYECPDFEQGFNAQCKQFTPLSETKVIRVTHPDDNIIEANWRCIDRCDQGLYLKAYRRPLEPIADNLLLYVENRALKSSPSSPVFDQLAMRTIYDDLPETTQGLQTYLTDNRPALSPDGQLLVVNDPDDVTWLANLASGTLHEISRPAVPVAWSPDSRQLAYLKDGSLYVLNTANLEVAAIWQQPALTNPRLDWPRRIRVDTDQTGWRISADGKQVVEVEPRPDPEAAIAEELARQGLPSTAAWALSHDEQRVAYAVQYAGPLKNAIFIFDLEEKTHTLVGPINGYRVPELRWSAGDELLLIGATNPKFPSGGAIFSMKPEADVLPEIVLESDRAYLVDIWPRP